jgi:hypothetical protein
MICHELTRIGLSPSALTCGSLMDDYLVRPGCQLSAQSLISLHDGKEALLYNPALNLSEYNSLSQQFILGFEQERRDANALGVVK